MTISIERSAEVGCELEGQGGLGVEPPGVQRAHETDETEHALMARGDEGSQAD